MNITPLTAPWNFDGNETQSWLRIWSAAWDSAGFNPVVIPSISPLRPPFDSLPVPYSEDKTFERRCHERWHRAAEWANLRNAAFFGLDYDLIPNPRLSYSLRSILQDAIAKADLHYIHGHAIIASPAGATRFANSLLSLAPHASDLNAALALHLPPGPPLIESFIPPTVDPAWSPTLPIIHFHTLVNHPYNRLKAATSFVPFATS